MKHPKEESWSDYVRGIADSGGVEALEEHLNSGCSACARKVEALRAVQRVSRIDAEFEVPAAALRAVQNIFRVQRLLDRQAETRSSFELSFDSSLTPATVGIRGSASQERHLVYESDDMTLDLQITTDEASERLKVAGQVMDSSSSPISDVPTFCYQSGRVSSQDLSGSLGEFEVFGEIGAKPRLCFLLGEDRLVDLELPPMESNANQAMTE